MATNWEAKPMSAATKLRRMVEDPNGFTFAPGVYDGFSARIAIGVGFGALYMTGAGTTASRLGQADLGIADCHDMRDHAEMIANLSPSLPVIADMDTGYGGPISVARNTAAYIRSGVAGFHIEDQVQSKRCGHLKGKELVPTDVFLSRIRAAVTTRKRLNSDIVIIARTDALQSFGYDEAISRLKAARDAGADVAFFEGMTSKDMCRQAIGDLYPLPMLLNMVEHGATPTIARDEAKEMGFRIMIWPFAALAPAYVAMRDALKELKDVGSMPSLEEVLTPRNLFEVCGLEESMRIDEEAGGMAFNKGA